MITNLDDGKKFEAKYSIKDQLADGGYGVVWRGVNKNTREQVAIKIIRKSNYETIDLPRLSVEIALCRRLSHKHLIHCYDVYELEDRHEVRIVMELARGEELFTLIQNMGKINEATSKILIRQLLLALQYLHSQNIVFRDVKPENILLKEPFAKGNYHTLLCDFGLAVVKGQEKAYGAFGSVYYIAPEALQPKEYTEKVDIWAAGIVAHACVTGYPPFCTESMNNEEIIKLIQTTELDIKTPELRHCSPAFIEFLERTICKNENIRVSATEALEMDWLRVSTNQSIAETKPVFTNYANFSQKK